MSSFGHARRALLLAAAALVGLPTAALGWEPTKPVEFVVPAGTGGGADQMSRLVQGIVQKHNLMKQPLIVVNKSGGAGAEGFLHIKEAKNDPHKIIITLSNLFTTPLATGVPFNWKDLTPVAMLALDQFVLWVNAESPYKSAKDYISAVKAAGPNKFKMGGTGSKQEDQIITVALEKATGTKFTYIPFKGGGTVAVQLVGKHIDSSVNNPIEGVAHWRGGKLRPLCVFDSERMAYKDKIAGDMAWHDIPSCKEAGVPVDYVMLRGIFTSPGVSQDAVDYYLGVFKKVRETPEWKKFMTDGAYNTTFMSGAEFVKWLEQAEATHRTLMQEAGFLAKK
ncbi:MAG: tripartite tricarboxylate transporter substrate binding protein [Burkholderiales bacterium]|nr:tripartite tricarboxylate transporter substrate binding protein [Burkholderiales bacterium]